MAIAGVITDAPEVTAWGRVNTVPPRLLALAFLTANMGVIVTGVAPLIVVAGIAGSTFLPRVLRSITLLFTLPPRAVGAMVGMVGDSWGRVRTFALEALFIVLRSRGSAALAALIIPDKKAIATMAVRIDFIHKPP